ncbi:hypothetical protein Mgra_00006000 [Meloidogyne graminicola]|uniref:Uncharacterized protein n=1 Tax=Meloidogyne graminicola TaxID=189291 RepID=A0A8S9ZMW5_9BILA|nr:hypothetical protein Mgra_00006000 [Meloidogyne graminicola]
MYNHPDLEKITPCPYKCLQCPQGGHPELREVEVYDKEHTWKISSGESDEEAGNEPIRTIYGQGKNNKKNKMKYGQFNKELALNVDAEEFDYLGGIGQEGFRNKGFKKEYLQQEQGTSKTRKQKEEVPQKIPNTQDFDKPITHWIKPEVLEEFKAKNLF